MYHTRRWLVFFEAKSRREIGRFVVYDGPLDPVSATESADHSKNDSIDSSTSPATLELRPGWCAGGAAEEQTSCPVERYRYNGRTLVRVTR
jgi:hypothetical protein